MSRLLIPALIIGALLVFDGTALAWVAACRRSRATDREIRALNAYLDALRDGRPIK